MDSNVEIILKNIINGEPVTIVPQSRVEILLVELAGKIGPGGSSVVVVTSLPETGEENKIYLVAKAEPSIDNLYDEYLWVDNKWEYIGTSSVDLSKYIKDVQIDTISIVEDGVAKIPYASTDKGGVIRTNSNYGTSMTGVGNLRGVVSSSDSYDAKNEYFFISKGTLDNIKTKYIKEGLTTNDIELTEEEKKSTKVWLGISESGDVSIVAEPYNDTRIYVPGDYVTYESDLYVADAFDIKDLFDEKYFCIKYNSTGGLVYYGSRSGYGAYKVTEDFALICSINGSKVVTFSNVRGGGDIRSNPGYHLSNNKLVDIDGDTWYVDDDGQIAWSPNYSVINNVTVDDDTDYVSVFKAMLKTGELPAYFKKTTVGKELVDINNTIDDIRLYKFPNATIVGNPTINNGQVSGFSSENYMKFPFLVDFKNKPFEIKMEFTTGSDVQNQQNIFDSDFGLAFAIRNGKFVMAVSTNGTSWDSGEMISASNVITNRTYVIKITWDGTTISMLSSVDGGSTFTNEVSKSLVSQPYPTQIYIGIGENFASVMNYFKGIINLNRCELRIDDILVWQGMDDVGLSTRADVSLSNIDSDGDKKIKSVVTRNMLIDDYDNLSEYEKKNGMIYFVDELPKTDKYDFISNDDETIVVRVDKTTNETIWFFNGFTKVDGGDISVDPIFSDYIPDIPSGGVSFVSCYSDSKDSAQSGWIGFYNNGGEVLIRSWDITTGYLIGGTFYANYNNNTGVTPSGVIVKYKTPTEGIGNESHDIYYMNTKYSSTGNEPILTSPNGTKYILSVNDDGALSTELVN